MNDCILIYLLFLHFIADFVCQTSWMAQNKSKNFLALFSHVLTYGLVLFLGTIYFGIDKAFLFSLVNFGLHLLVDFFTSKATSYLWKKGDVHNFFVVIGLDQLIHQACLILTGCCFVLAK